MRDVAGDNSLRRRLGLGAWLAVGALLAFGVVQASLVVASPATIDAAGNAQTQSANVESQQFVAFTAVQSQTCSYPDVCSPTPTTPPSTTPTPDLPPSQSCMATSVVTATVAPFVSASDDCGTARSILLNAGCTLMEAVGIGADRLPTDSPDLPAAYAAARAAGTNMAIYQTWTCAGGVSVSLTTNI